MIPAIITLVIGLVIVIISFFIGENKKEDNTETTLAEGREKIEKQLDEYCDLIVEKKKNDLKKQGEDVRNNMKKDLDDIKKASKKEIDEYRENARKEIEEFKASTDKNISEMSEDVNQRIDKAVKAYESDIENAKIRMKSELEACSAQLSEKAKKQMIDYINQSLTEAYEAYDPEDTSEKEKITYDEAEDTDSVQNDDQPAEEYVPDSQNEDADDEIKVEPITDSQETVVAVEENQVTDSAFTVVEAENPEKMAAAIEEGNVVLEPQVHSNRSKRKKKKKSSQSKPLDIWDEGEDIETQVADLNKKGLSIMEIANTLGIGVGEAKVMIDQINEKNIQNQIKDNGRQ